MAEIWQWNVAQTTAHLADAKISAREVAEAHLARLDEVNPALNAVTNDVRAEALAVAADLDATFAASGPVGPLHGVPITIKENVDVEGQVTPNGMPILADVIAPSDSPLVSHLRAAGAVIIGRTNTPEMSYRWHTNNPLRGETKNPWSPLRTPGGSSGGAASSLAAGIGAFAHGNDLGGSIRQPANCCGLAGIRPSLGRVAAWNPSAMAERTLALLMMSVQGPLGREVADVRTALEIMMQPNADDPWHRPQPLVPAHAGSHPHQRRVAVTYGTGATATTPEVRTAVDNAARHLDEAGWVVDYIDPPEFDAILNGWQSLLATEVSVSGLEELKSIASEDFMKAISWMFDGDAVLDLAGYVAAWTQRSTILRNWSQFMDQWPLILAPVSQEKPFAPNDDVSSRDRFLEIMTAHTPLVAVNYLGLPAVAVPSALFDDGPVGVQVIGRAFREDQCLDAAAVIEAGAGVMAPILWDRMSA